MRVLPVRFLLAAVPDSGNPGAGEMRQPLASTIERLHQAPAWARKLGVGVTSASG